MQTFENGDERFQTKGLMKLCDWLTSAIRFCCRWNGFQVDWGLELLLFSFKVNIPE